MVEASIIGSDDVRRAAEELINEYGPEALAIAKKRAIALRREGFESIAQAWDLILQRNREFGRQPRGVQAGPQTEYLPFRMILSHLARMVVLFFGQHNSLTTRRP